MEKITTETILQLADLEAGPECCDEEYRKARRLMAAAPELLAALTQMCIWVSDDSSLPEKIRTAATNALMKATGEQP